MADRTVKVTLTLNAAQYQSALKNAGRDTQALAAQAGKTGVSLKQMLTVAATSTASLAVAKLLKDSISLEAQYSRTMRQVAVAAKAPAAALQDLDDLAMKLGADTVYSAQDAAAAMLELAKGGLSPAQIEAGALKNSLTLAAAGNLELSDAANAVVNTMGAFGIRADDTASAVAALAGAANASTADVSDMTQALSQVGTEANSTGLSVQETTAMLAAFSNQGFKGSDAGTALKTMLTLLVPQTKKAKDEMARLGLSFTKSNGEFVSGAEIAGRLQKAFGDMSAKERSAALTTIFGADGRRAANALINEGSKGIKDLTKETSDLQAAQKLADAGMAGTSGALEQLSGNVETAKIQIGKGLAPTVKDLADRTSDLVGNGDFEAWAAQAGEGISSFLDEVGPLAASLADLAQESLPALKSAGQATIDVLKAAADVVTPMVEAFNSLPDSAQKALILAAGAQQIGKRLGPIPGLADSAGTSLVGFGGNARRGGDDAEKGGRKFAALGGSLKDFALIAGAIKAGEMGADIFDSFSRSAKANNGKTSVVTDIEEQLKNSNVGKYAEDLGIDIARLATEMARYGEKGEYYAEVTERMASSSEGLDGLAKSFGSWINPLITDLEKAGLATHDLGDIASEAALKVDEQKNAYNLLVGGLGAYSEQLKGLPSRAVTEITTPGAVKSKQDVIDLANEYALTPDEVTTVMKALGFSTDRIAAVKKAMQDLDGTTAKVTTIEETIKRTIKESYTKKGATGGNNPAVDKAFDGPGGYAGMRIPAGYAQGGRDSEFSGRVPGTAPSDKKTDNMLAITNKGNPIRVRSREWIVNEKSSDENDYWLGLINSGLVIDDLIGGILNGYVAGGKPSALEIKSQERTVRDLERSLREREAYGKKPKGGKRPTRLALRGLDRQIAQLELADARRELADLKSGAGSRSEAQDERVSSAMSTRDSVASSLAGGFGLGQFTGKNEYGFYNQLKGSTIAAGAAAFAAKIKAFAGKFEAARKLGIPVAMLQEAASLGVDEGTQALDALLSSSAGDIASLQASYRDIETYANGAGEVLAKALDLATAGQDSATGYAEGFINGLNGYATAIGDAINNATQGKKTTVPAKGGGLTAYGVVKPLPAQPGLNTGGSWGTSNPQTFTAEAFGAGYAASAAQPVPIDYDQLAAAMSVRPTTVNANLLVSGRQAGTLVQAGQTALERQE